MFNKKQILIFISVGLLNSMIDFSIYTVLLSMNVPLRLSIVIAAFLAMMISYFLNSKFTFQTKNTNRNILLFFLVTTTGIGIRYIVAYIITTTLLDKFIITTSNSIYHITNLMPLIAISSNSLHNTIIWGISILIAMIYNFILYKKVVFK